MTAPDFAAILAAHTTADGADVPDQLAAKVPELCRTCDGDGCAALGPNGHDGPCRPCPDCPTIAKLLAIGAAVMSGEIGSEPLLASDQAQNRMERDELWEESGRRDLLTQLRAVQP